MTNPTGEPWHSGSDIKATNITIVGDNNRLHIHEQILPSPRLTLHPDANSALLTRRLSLPPGNWIIQDGHLPTQAPTYHEVHPPTHQPHHIYVPAPTNLPAVVHPTIFQSGEGFGRAESRLQGPGISNSGDPFGSAFFANNIVINGKKRRGRRSSNPDHNDDGDDDEDDDGNDGDGGHRAPPLPTRRDSHQPSGTPGPGGKTPGSGGKRKPVKHYDMFVYPTAPGSLRRHSHEDGTFSYADPGSFGEVYHTSAAATIPSVIRPHHTDLLAGLWDEIMTNPSHGIYPRYIAMRCNRRFTENSGPLRGRCMRDLRLCAALICCQAAYHEVSPGYWMCNLIKKMNGWTTRPTDHIYYEKAMSMAKFICGCRYSTEDPSMPRLHPQEIMNVDIYTIVSKMVTVLNLHGVSSDKAHNIGNSNDILGGIYFPTFLCIDKLLHKSDWGEVCPLERLWASAEEKQLYQNNQPLLDGV